MFGEAIALAAQFFQFLRAQRLAQHFVGVAGSVKAGANMRLQHHGLHAAAMQHVGKGFHGGAVERGAAQDQRMRTGPPGLLQNIGDGIFRHVAIEQRRAKRAVGIGADQSGQGDLVGAPHRDHRHQADQGGCIAPRAERGGIEAAPRRSVHRQFPFGQIIAVRLGGAHRERAPLGRGNAGERHQRSAGLRARAFASMLDARRTVDVSAVSVTSPNPRSRFMRPTAPGGCRLRHRVHGATLAARGGK